MRDLGKPGTGSSGFYGRWASYRTQGRERGKAIKKNVQGFLRNTSGVMHSYLYKDVNSYIAGISS
jgi:hypothetical protein